MTRGERDALLWQAHCADAAQERLDRQQFDLTCVEVQNLGHAARAAVPALCRELDRLEEENAALRAGNLALAEHLKICSEELGRLAEGFTAEKRALQSLFVRG